MTAGEPLHLGPKSSISLKILVISAAMHGLTCFAPSFASSLLSSDPASLFLLSGVSLRFFPGQGPFHVGPFLSFC